MVFTGLRRLRDPRRGDGSTNLVFLAGGMVRRLVGVVSSGW